MCVPYGKPYGWGGRHLFGRGIKANWIYHINTPVLQDSAAWGGSGGGIKAISVRDLAVTLSTCRSYGSAVFRITPAVARKRCQRNSSVFSPANHSWRNEAVSIQVVVYFVVASAATPPRAARSTRNIRTSEPLTGVRLSTQTCYCLQWRGKRSTRFSTF